MLGSTGQSNSVHPMAVWKQREKKQAYDRLHLSKAQPVDPLPGDRMA